MTSVSCYVANSSNRPIYGILFLEQPESNEHSHGYEGNGLQPLNVSMTLRGDDWHTVSLYHSICEIHKKLWQQTKLLHEMGAVSRRYHAKVMETKNANCVEAGTIFSVRKCFTA